jgi:hypothetical protein
VKHLVIQSLDVFVDQPMGWLDDKFMIERLVLLAVVWMTG